jgi:hypothetical protein
MMERFNLGACLQEKSFCETFRNPSAENGRSKRLSQPAIEQPCAAWFSERVPSVAASVEADANGIIFVMDGLLGWDFRPPHSGMATAPEPTQQ